MRLLHRQRCPRTPAARDGAEEKGTRLMEGSP